MKKRKILLPLATIGAVAATVAPICMTGCSCRAGLMGTHDMLDANYKHHVLPASSRSIIGQDVLISEYLRKSADYTDIIKDDILYTYSKVLTTKEYTDKLDFNFSRYFLYVDDIKVDTKNQTLNFILWAEITGTTKNEKRSAHTYGGNEIRDFTLLLGAELSASYTVISAVKETTGVFNNSIRMVLNPVEDESATIRTRAIGNLTVGASSTAPNQSVNIDVDTMAKVSQDTDTKRLFNDLIYSIPEKGLLVSNGKFVIESYYLKNISYTA